MAGPLSNATEGSAAPARPEDETLHLAYAEASILLIESLMLHLVERGIVSAAELIESMETAIETKREFVRDGVHPQLASLAGGVIARISNSVGSTRPR
jgi:hypothetical protein